jgi:hypothetical protein
MGKGAVMVDDSNAEQPNTDILPARNARAKHAEVPIEDVMVEAIRNRTLGMSLPSVTIWIEQEFGIRVDTATVAHWCGENEASYRNITPKRTAELRATDATRLEALIQLAMHQAITFAGTKFGLDSMAQAGKLIDAHARLLGLIMPVRYDVDMRVETEQDRALRAMLEQATVKLQQDERRVIEQASADQDL